MMNKEAIIAKKAPAAVGPYSHACKAGNLLFISGQLPLKDGQIVTDVEEATEASILNLKIVLEDQGLTLDNVVKTLVFVKDMGDFAKINAVYAKYFTKDFPARSLIEVARLPKDAVVEIEAVAAY